MLYKSNPAIYKLISYKPTYFSDKMAEISQRCMSWVQGTAPNAECDC